MLLMNLEQRPIVFEDIGRQILANGFYKPPEDYIKEIGKQKHSDYQDLSSHVKSTRALT